MRLDLSQALLSRLNPPREVEAGTGRTCEACRTAILSNRMVLVWGNGNAMFIVHTGCAKMAGLKFKPFVPEIKKIRIYTIGPAFANEKVEFCNETSDEGRVTFEGLFPVSNFKEATMATATATAATGKKAWKDSAKAAPKEIKEKKPKAPRTSATEQELEAAVQGNLKVRETKGNKAQDSLTARTEDDRPAGRPLGLTTGFPILLAWCYIFQENEKHKLADRMTDEQITAWMKKEFPGRNTPAFDHPQTCRRDYNVGRFTKNVKPRVPSRRFDENGAVIEEGRRKAKPAAKETKGDGKGAAKGAKKAPKEIVEL